MKNLILLLIISLALLINCNEEPIKNTQPIIEVVEVDSIQIEINLLKKELIDSAMLDSTLTDKDLFVFIMDSLYRFDYESNNLNEKLINYKYLKSKIEIKPFNDNKIILVYYDDYYNLDHSINYIFISNNKKILENDFIRGCKYHNGKIKVKDWNKDGLDELVFQIDNPTSSEAFIQNLEDVYDYDSINGLRNIFNIVLETKDCNGTRKNKGEYIKSSYRFVSKLKIKVQETISSFNCADFDFHGEIKNITKQKVRSYFMSWDSIENRFME